MSDVKQSMEARRSVNFFDPAQDLSPATLQSIINLAVLAPSAFNLQPWRIIAVKSPEGKQRLYAKANKQDKILEAPVTLIMVGDRSGYETANPAWAELGDMLHDEAKVQGSQQFARALYGTSEERRIKFAESNTALLAMSIMYAAQYYHVDSHPMSGIDFAGIKDEFSLKDTEEVVLLIALGHFDAAKSLYPRRKRRGYQEIVEEV